MITLDLYVAHLQVRHRVHTPIIIYHTDYRINRIEATFTDHESIIITPEVPNLLITNIHNSKHYTVEEACLPEPPFIYNTLKSNALIVRDKPITVSTFTLPEPNPNYIDPSSKNILISFALVLIIIAGYEVATIFKL